MRSRAAILVFLCCGACVLGNPRELPEVAAEPAAAPPGRTDPRAASYAPIAASVEGRPLRTLSLGSGPRRVLWIGGIHGNELEGTVATAELPAAFAAAGLEKRVTLTILEDANPDGRAKRRRENANGVDLNRNFPARNFDDQRKAFGETPLSQPEARAVHDLIVRLDPDLVMVAHGWRGKRFVNFDGPAEEAAKLFSERSGLPLVRSSEFAKTPGSLGSWVGVDLKKPILTVEWLHGQDPRECWDQAKSAIVAAIAGT
jgi:hypothetical protein